MKSCIFFLFYLEALFIAKIALIGIMAIYWPIITILSFFESITIKCSKLFMLRTCTWILILFFCPVTRREDERRIFWLLFIK